jgi:hypothetical protein
MVGVVNSEQEARDLVGRGVMVPGLGYVAILGYRPTASGTFVLTSLPQAALDAEPDGHPMDGAWKLSCGRWLMQDQLPEIERRPGVRVRGPSCDHEDTLVAEWPAPL